LLYLVAIFSILLFSIPVWTKVLAALLLIVMAYKAIEKHVLFNADESIVKINCTNNNICKVELKNGKVYKTNVTSASWLFNYFLIIVLQNNKMKLSAAIAKDTMSQEQLYAFRLYLRSLNTQR